VNGRRAPYQLVVATIDRRDRVLAAQQVVGSDLWRKPDSETLAALEAITSEERRRDLNKRVRHVRSWQELLGNGS
jgi:hypothetical protein